MVDIQSMTAEIRRGKKKEEEETTGQKYNVRMLRRAAIITVALTGYFEWGCYSFNYEL